MIAPLITEEEPVAEEISPAAQIEEMLFEQQERHEVDPNLFTELDDVEGDSDAEDLIKIVEEETEHELIADTDASAMEEQTPIVTEAVELVRPGKHSARIAGGVRRPDKYVHHISVKKGIKKHGSDAVDAIRKELLQLLRQKQVLRPVMYQSLSRKQIKGILRSSMFLKEKFDAKGWFEKLKARLVANGAQQDRRLFDDLSSPTAAIQSLMIYINLNFGVRFMIG